MAFSRAVGAYWALLMYCVACTMMQGIFCLGELLSRTLSRFALTVGLIKALFGE
jgi:hypothetical protein